MVGQYFLHRQLRTFNTSKGRCSEEMACGLSYPTLVDADAKHSLSIAVLAVIAEVPVSRVANSVSVLNGFTSPLSTASTSPVILSG
jgi:hypothetical protein